MKAIAPSLLKWFDQHGRKSLPWQIDKTPYRVWISEIMLQQTQVATVIPYFERFMQRFPQLSLLAQAHEDEVLHLWAGLGYYSRARNIHRTAKKIMQDFAGIFPDNLPDLQSLPGIGQSTAGAILAIAFGFAIPILDGNVKRVLTRLHGITDPINDRQTEQALWTLAETYTPTKRAADYTQAIMDLGATLCTRSQPDCARCPFKRQCVAHANNMTAMIPSKRKTKKIPTKQATLLILRRGDDVLLYKRPAKGIWGGLFSMPEIAGHVELPDIRAFCLDHYHIKVSTEQRLPVFRHTFSHYHLDIQPVVLKLATHVGKVMEDNGQIWYNLQQPCKVGLPKPIQTLLRELS